MLATAMRRKPSATSRVSGVVPVASPTRAAIGLESGTHRVRVEPFVAVRAEDRREMRGLDLADADIGVGDGERAAAAVAGRAGIGAGAFGADAVARAVEVQDRAAARGDRVDRHHRRAHPHARDFGLERALELARVERDVGRGAAHVEADHLIEPGHRRRARGADDAAGRAGQDRVLALEARGLRQPAMGLHEVEPRAAELGRHLIDVAAQDRREIRVHDRRVGARDEAEQRADLVARGYLREPGLARERRQALLVRRMLPRMDQRDRAGRDAVRARSRQHGARRVLVQRLDLRAVHGDAAGDLGDALVEQARAA